MKNLTLAIALVAAGVMAFFSMFVAAAPVDEELIIDGEFNMITRTASPEGHPLSEVTSGWLYRTDETRDQQADSFENPGMLAVEEGEVFWNTVDGSAGKSCASCHDDAATSMKGVGAKYPVWDVASSKPINIEQRINLCRIDNMGAQAWEFDEQGQKPLAAYIKNQSLGLPVSMKLDEGDMQKWWEKGKETYYSRMGQLDFSCANCHEQYNGSYIRADHLSQGNANGFPTFRQKQGTLVSLHSRFQGCIRDTRAEIPEAFSDDMMALEVYVTWRGTGLSVETPAVRQ
ncbi:sulfur oxidation c-type cytochrome SoxA [Granulosicoccus antarcticus]|uniref:sulfur oxidation c-type cytochrome SoxA n=1 Tax=Granulosicoccus antarcticus TaxID=437505 RepID=UPI00197ABDA0|nr:sulfur oxidation c-type cytochrome SoxA [Granulosicoccus antarcticus]